MLNAVARVGEGLVASATGRASALPADRIDDAVARRVAAAAGATPSAEARDWAPPRAPEPSNAGQAARASAGASAPVAAPASAPAAANITAAPPATSAPVDDITLARLAKAAYVDGAAPPAGWRAATGADLLAIGVRPADLVSPNSAFRARVYAQGGGDGGGGADARFVVAFRGSTRDGGDWITNGRQAAGLGTDHYTAALAVGRRIAASGAGDRVTLTGHSLGGGLASAAAIASGRDAVTFNAAGLSRQTIAGARRVAQETGADRTPDIRAYHVRGEVLSAVQDGGDRMMGALLGAALTRTWSGAALGHRIVDAPEAYGTRIPLDAVRPPGAAWYETHAAARHGLDYVLSGLGARP